MGLLGDFIDQETLDSVDVAGGYGQNEDGIYQGILSDAFVREGTDNYPDRVWIVLEYELDNGTQENEWFQLPDEPGNPTSAENTKLGFLIRRLGDLGISRERVYSFDPDEIIGTKVAITLRTTRGKGKNSDKTYQNVTKLTVIPAEEAKPAAPAEAPARAAGGTRRPNPAARRA